MTFFPVLHARANGRDCPVFSLDDFRQLLDAAQANPRIGSDNKTRGAIHLFRGISFYQQDRLDEAVRQLDASFEAWPEIDVRLRQVVWLLSANRTLDAQRHLDLARQFRAERFWRKNLRGKDIESLQQIINDRSN